MNYLTYKRKILALDAEWHETDHPRDDDGKFTDGNTTSATKSDPHDLRLVVKPVADIKAYRKQTLQWYKDNLQGTTVTNRILGEIRFSLKGGTHVLHNSAPSKLALVRHLPHLIQNGETDGWQELKKPRNDGYVAFANIFNAVSINGERKSVLVIIAKDANGKIFYDIGFNKNQSAIQTLTVGGQAGSTLDAYTVSVKPTIVNIFIDDEIKPEKSI